LGFAANTKSSPQLPDLHTKGNYSRHEKGDDEQKSPDQQFIMHVSPTKVEQFTVNYEINESNRQQQFSQLEHQHEEVFPYDFNDPIANYLEFMNNINIKIFL